MNLLSIKSLLYATSFYQFPNTQTYMIREMQLRGCPTTKQNFSIYEKGQAYISAYEIVVITQILNISLNSLLGVTEEYS